MNQRSIIVLLISILWGALCWYWYVIHIKGFDFKKSEIELTKNYNSSVSFKKSSAEFIIGNTFEQFADSLKMAISNGYKVTLVGLFDLSEINNTSYLNLGIARVHSIKSVLSTYLDTSKIESLSKPFTFTGNNQSQICHQWIIDSLTADSTFQTNSESEKTQTNPDEKSANSKEVIYTIYFEPNSNQIINKIEVVKFLEDLSEELITKNSRITVTGYRDINEKEKLDRSRAWLIKSILIKNGALGETIKTDGKGDLEAINNSNTNRNRRVEIK